MATLPVGVYSREDNEILKNDLYLQDLLDGDEIATDDTAVAAEDDVTSPTWTGPSTTRFYSGFAEKTRLTDFKNHRF